MLNAKVKCDMDDSCEDDICMIDDKGYVYCRRHGVMRKQSRPCRMLKTHELDSINHGEQIKEF